VTVQRGANLGGADSFPGTRLRRARQARGWRTLPSEMVQHGYTPRRSAGLAAYENVLARAGLAPVAGIDEAGRGACAGPLVVAAVVLDLAGIRRMPQLADSKLLTPAAREDAYTHIVAHAVTGTW
jgi:ribonuclease HIII